ncbi:hypothetical protein ACJMK2_032977 [Sinanodonta woodiana]|uniref:Cadherin domain-containing protein n=1 Tax=Sinanodonta woodiana TaxID=1069815 RepID=A0ABD3X6Z2_SINWO
MECRVCNVCKLTNIIIVCFLFLTSVQAIGEADVRYKINEEQIIGTIVGTIKSDVDIRSTISELEYNNLVFSLFSAGNPYAAFFKINNKTSDLAVGSRIDRDNLSVCTFTEKCVISVDVAVQTGGAFFRKLKVDIEIVDRNDNSPTFAMKEVEVKIAESTTGKSPASFSGALDADYGLFSVQNYTILEADTPFGVQYEKLADGSSIVTIIVQKGLDRETQDLYKLTVVAQDGGNPMRTGTLKITVVITDVNDNAPKFTQSLYNVTIKEDIELSSTILTLSATDADINENGEIVYKLSAHQIENVPSMFSINPVYGALSVVAQLVYVPNEVLRVFVEASDKGVPPKISQTVVYVNIEDSNNHPPQININFLAGSDVARVSEFANVGTVVAHIGVVDDDTGRNGIVTCTGVSDKFGLERLDVNEYKVIVTKSLDRELTSVHIVDIFCYDNGSPPLNSSRRFNVTILDENDVAPRFTQGTYFVKTDENNQIGDMIIKVSAEDLDIGINAVLTYFLIDDGGFDFRINPNTGEIRAYFVMDRENISRVTLKVKAVDGGIKQKLTGEATIVININDQNDNAPAFDQPEYKFTVEENASLMSKVGQVIATDPDDGENGTIVYSILPSPSYDFPFTLYSNGTILTTWELDREVESQYNITVVATDQGNIPLSSSVYVVISVSDQNDNPPIFIFPNKDNNTVLVFYAALSGTVIADVTASDSDDGKNALLSYSIVDSNVTDIFTMEMNTGKITLKRMHTSSDPTIFTIRVKVEDNGTIRRSSIAYLTIAFSQALESKEGGDDNKNFLIAVSLTCITVVLSVAIVLIICLIKRHDRLKIKEGGVRAMQITAGDTTQGLVLKGDQLRKVTFPMEYDAKTKTKESIQVPMASQEVYQISNRLRGDSNMTSSDSGLSSFSGHQTRSDIMAFSTNQPPLHSGLMATNERPRVRPQEQLWTIHDERNTPPLTKDILKQHEDNGSESSGETTTSDSGRGGSESDIHSATFSASHDQTETTKTVTFASKPLLHHIEMEPTWTYSGDGSSSYGNNTKDLLSNHSWNQNEYPSSHSIIRSDLSSDNSKSPRDISTSLNNCKHLSYPYHKSKLSLTTSHKNKFEEMNKMDNLCVKDNQDFTSSHGESSSVGFGTSYDDDDDTTTSGSYTIDADDCQSDSHNDSRNFFLAHDEAYC